MKKSIILGAMAFFLINIAGIQNADAQVNKQREQMLQATNEPNELNEKAKSDLIIVSMEDLINKLGVNQDSSYRNRMMTTEPGKTLTKKKILIKPEKKPKE